MAGLTLLTSAVFLLCLTTQCYCTTNPSVQNVSPPSNTTIGELVGPANVQFNCDTYEEVQNGTDVQVTTAWFLRFPSEENLFFITVLGGVPTQPSFNLNGTARVVGPFPTFRNVLTLTNMTNALDDAWLICGHSVQEFNDLARWRLRLYSPPFLSDGQVIKVDERDGNIPVDITTLPLAYPTPSSYELTKDGSPVATTSRITFGYPSVIFNSILRSDSGLYSLSATNYRTDNALPIGTGQGSFTLDVLYGPDIVRSTDIYSVVVGEPITIVCGTSLDSNPMMASISWLDQTGTPIPNAGRYTFNNGTDEVSLDFAFTRAGDSGVWACVLVVRDPDVMVASGGELVTRDNKEIGRLTNQITLVVVVPSSEPTLVAVQSESTNATLTWSKPSDVGHPGVTAYQITADDGINTPITYTSADNNTAQTITGLLPGREYRFTVRALVGSGDAVAISNASLPVYSNTTFTVPSPRCESAVSDNGAIAITWSLIHTGGLPLASLSVSYSYTEGLNIVQGDRVAMVSVDDTSAPFSELVTGFAYTFTVTAVNSLGSSMSVCAPVEHLIGVPMEPRQPTVIAVAPNAVDVTMETTSPGVPQGAVFYYDIKYAAVQDISVTGSMVVEVSIGGPITREVGGLIRGHVYVFSVRSRNMFGESRFVTSEPINFNGTNTVATTSSPIGAVVGGIVGGVIVVILIILIIVVVVIVLLRVKEGGSYRVSNKKARNSYSSTLETTRIDSSAGVKVEEVPLDVGFQLEDGGPKELHYADLESFRPPSATPTQQKPTSPTTEERVEYATIDTFKKPPSEGTPPDNGGTPDNGQPPTTV